jgi:hypothetical protein
LNCSDLCAMAEQRFDRARWGKADQKLYAPDLLYVWGSGLYGRDEDCGERNTNGD